MSHLPLARCATLESNWFAVECCPENLVKSGSSSASDGGCDKREGEQLLKAHMRVTCLSGSMWNQIWISGLVEYHGSPCPSAQCL